MHKCRSPDLPLFGNNTSAQRKSYTPFLASTKESCNFKPYLKRPCAGLRPSLLKRRLLEANTFYVPTYTSCYMNYCTPQHSKGSPMYAPPPQQSKLTSPIYGSPAKGYSYLTGTYTSKYPSSLSSKSRGLKWKSSASLQQSHLPDPLFNSAFPTQPIVKDVFLPNTLKSVRTPTNKDEFIRNTLDSVRRSNALVTLKKSRLDFSESERMNPNAEKRREIVKYYSSYEESDRNWMPCTLGATQITGTSVERKKKVDAKTAENVSEPSETKTSKSKNDPENLRTALTQCQTLTDSRENVILETDVPKGGKITVSIKKIPEKEIVRTLKIIKNKIEEKLKETPTIKADFLKDEKMVKHTEQVHKKCENLKLRDLSDVLRHEDWIKKDSERFSRFIQIKTEAFKNETAKAQEPEVINVNTDGSETEGSTMEITEDITAHLKSLSKLKEASSIGTTKSKITETPNVNIGEDETAKSTTELSENSIKKITAEITKSLTNVIETVEPFSAGKYRNADDATSRYKFNAHNEDNTETPNEFKVEKLTVPLSEHQMSEMNPSNSTKTITVPAEISTTTDENKIGSEEITQDTLTVSKNLDSHFSHLTFTISSDLEATTVPAEIPTITDENKIGSEEMTQDILTVSKNIDGHFSHLTYTVPSDSEATIKYIDNQAMYNTSQTSEVITCPPDEEVTFIKKIHQNRRQISASKNSNLDDIGSINSDLAASGSINSDLANSGSINSHLDTSGTTLLEFRLNFSEPFSDCSFSNRLRTTLAFPSVRSSYSRFISRDSFSSDAVSLYQKNWVKSNHQWKARADRVSHEDSNILGDKDLEEIRNQSKKMVAQDLDKFKSRDRIGSGDLDKFKSKDRIGSGDLDECILSQTKMCAKRK